MANSVEVVSDPKRKENCDYLQKCFERSYDLSKNGDKMTLVEAMSEIGKVVAVSASTATLTLSFGQDGITGVSVTSIPKKVPPAKVEEE